MEIMKSVVGLKYNDYNSDNSFVFNWYYVADFARSNTLDHKHSD